MLTKTVIGKKSDAHDSKESSCSGSQLKKPIKFFFLGGGDAFLFTAVGKHVVNNTANSH